MKNGAGLSKKPLKRQTDKVLFLQILLILAGILAIAAGIWRDEHCIYESNLYMSGVYRNWLNGPLVSEKRCRVYGRF